MPQIRLQLEQVKEQAGEIDESSSKQEMQILYERIRKANGTLNGIDETCGEKSIKIENLIAARINYDKKLDEVESLLARFQADSDNFELVEMDSDLGVLKGHIDSVKSMKESLKQAGQPWQPERQLKIVTKFHQAQNALRSATAKQTQLEEMRAEFDAIFTSADKTLRAIVTPQTDEENAESELMQKMACCHVTIADLGQVRGWHFEKVWVKFREIRKNPR